MSIGDAMPPSRNTWLFQPGSWNAVGRFWNEGQLERPAHGASILTHRKAIWEIEGEFATSEHMTSLAPDCQRALDSGATVSDRSMKLGRQACNR